MDYLKEPICDCGGDEVVYMPPDGVAACKDCGSILEGNIEPGNLVKEDDL